MKDVVGLSQLSLLSSDLFYIANAKLARRSIKVGRAMDQSVLHAVTKVMQDNHRTLRAQWMEFERKDKPHCDLSQLVILDFQSDTIFRLPELDDFLESVRMRQRSESSSTFQPSSRLAKYRSDHLPDETELRNAYPDRFSYELQALEHWIASRLRGWIAVHKDEGDTCFLLANLTSTYHDIATRHYFCNPEATSVMLLTILKL